VADRPARFVAKPVAVEAMPFGRFGDLYAIAAWCPQVYAVPQGYDHHLRRPTERDTATSDCLPDAPPFLVLRSTDGTARIDVGGWLMRTADSKFHAMPHVAFSDAYDPEVPRG